MQLLAREGLLKRPSSSHVELPSADLEAEAVNMWELAKASPRLCSIRMHLGISRLTYRRREGFYRKEQTCIFYSPGASFVQMTLGGVNLMERTSSKSEKGFLKVFRKFYNRCALRARQSDVYYTLKRVVIPQNGLVVNPETEESKIIRKYLEDAGIPTNPGEMTYEDIELIENALLLDAVYLGKFIFNT